MTRIAIIVTCLAIVLAVPASADEVTIPLSHTNAAEVCRLFTGELPEWQALAHGGQVDLPAGVEEIEPVMAENALRVAGTAEGIAELREMLELLDVPRKQIEIATRWIELHDPSVLGYALAVDEPDAHIALPRIAVFTDMSDEEVAALAEAGTVLSEPHVTVMGGMPGQIAFGIDTDNDGAQDVGTGLGLVAHVLLNDAISVQIDLWTYDRRPEAAEAETSLQVLLRIANGETVALARVGEDGAILNPVYLVTARVIRDLAQAED